MNDLYDRPVNIRFEHLLQVISSKSFLEMQGLNNEIPFFIFPYMPPEQNQISEMSQLLIKRLASEGIIILEINIYDLTITLLKEQGVWESILENETSLTKKELMEDLQSSLNSEHHLVPAITERIETESFDILFLTGIGEVFPYIRSHNILNSLQSIAKTFPTIMWFPGKYSYTLEGGSSLDLFDHLHDDKYYRAFNILEYQLE